MSGYFSATLHSDVKASFCDGMTLFESICSIAPHIEAMSEKPACLIAVIKMKSSKIAKELTGESWPLEHTHWQCFEPLMDAGTRL
jgi:hypothetical protein